MKRLFVLWVLCMGCLAGANAQELDKILFGSDSKGKVLVFRISGTPGSRFVIRDWQEQAKDTIHIKTEAPVSVTYPSTGSFFTLSGLSSQDRLTSLHIDGVYKYTNISITGGAAIKSIVVSDIGLNTLSIGTCSALKHLDCSHNNLTTLDLSVSDSLTYLDCSANPSLATLEVNAPVETLKLSDNPKLTSLNLKNVQLTALDVSQMALETLTCNDCPQMQSLDCSNSPLTSLQLNNLSTLQTLDCSHTQLTSLSLPELPALQTLACSHAHLAVLNIADLPALQTLDCSANPLLTTLEVDAPIETLKLSDNPKLTSLNIKNVRLAALDVSQTALETLTCNDCPQMQVLDCSNSPLTSLQLNNLSTLQTLDCSHTQLTSLSLSDLSDLPALQTLNCSNSALTTLDLSRGKFPHLQTLDCSNSSLARLDLSRGEFLVLQSLNCSHTPLTKLLFPDTVPALQVLDCSNTQLESLYLAGVRFPALQVLDCSNTQLESLYVAGVRFPSLQMLDCSNTQLTNLSLSDLPALQTLDCSNTQLTHLSLPDLPALQTLDCSNTQLINLSLSDLLSLQMLDCHNTQLELLDLPELPSLQMIDCSDNALLTILSVHETALATLDLSTNTALTQVWCPNNQLRNLILPQNFVLHELTCDSNHLTMSAVAALFEQSKGGRYSPQFIDTIFPVTTPLDLHSEMSVGHYAGYEVYLEDGATSAEPFYTENDSCFLFKQAGRYQLRLTSSMYKESGLGWPIEVFYTLTIVDTVTAPVFSIASGLVKRGTLLNLSAEPLGAEIYYTIDGSEPSVEALRYTMPIRIDSAMTVKAIAVKDTLTSQVVEAVYMVLEKPIFSVSAGAVRRGTLVSLSAEPAGAKIYYTIDGSEPTTEARHYTTPIRIDSAMTVKAIAIKDTLSSQVVEAVYMVLEEPIFSVSAGAVRRGTPVSLSAEPAGAEIYYTVDGSEPTVEALRYTKPIRIDSAMTIKAVAVKDTLTSQVSEATYTIDVTANENELAGNSLVVYSLDKTIYLSEACGEVEVFATGGQCVYRGTATAIPVKKAGLYIVKAGGQRVKVVVR